MNKLIKAIIALLGVTVIGGIVVKERNTLNDLRKRLFDIRWCEPKQEESKK